jgi:hypothetical protein
VAFPAPVLAFGGFGLTERVTDAQARITSPERFFGFWMGADRKPVRWDQAVEYYQLLRKEADWKLNVVNMAPELVCHRVS